MLSVDINIDTRELAQVVAKLRNAEAPLTQEMFAKQGVAPTEENKAIYQQMQAETSQMTAASQLPEAQEQALDEYPMPDEQVSTPDMQEYGYS